MAVVPDYTSLLLLRVLQGLVSKGSWTAGFTLSECPLGGGRGVRSHGGQVGGVGGMKPNVEVNFGGKRVFAL